MAIVFPQQELKIADRIIAIGFEVFFPRLKKLVVRRGRRCVDIKPLFPNYLIVKQSEDVDQVSQINDTRGVIDVLMTADNTPAKLRDRDVNRIKDRCTGDGYLITPKSKAAFLVGERVRPKSGALQYHVGIFTSAHSHHRVSALFNLFGREVTATFRVGELVAA